MLDLLPGVRAFDVAFHNTLLVWIGFFFLFDELSGAKMAPEVYGEVVYAMPAEAWAIAVMIAHGSVLTIFLSKSPAFLWAAQSGAALQMAIYGAFAFFAKSAEMGSHLWLFAGVFFFPHALVTLARLAREMRHV